MFVKYLSVRSYSINNTQSINNIENKWKGDEMSHESQST